MKRRRVGLMIPSSNTVMEPDFVRGLPTDATVHTARMCMEETTPAGESRMLDEFALPAARDVGTARPDVVVFGCTSAGALRGNDYDEKLCRWISEETAAPTISVIASVRKALATTGRRVGVVTPYVEALNVKIKESLEADGLEVVKITGLGIAENFEIGTVPPAQVVDHTVGELDGLDIDLVFVSCTNFRAVEAIPELERRLGLPVVTSNQAALAATRTFLADADGGADGGRRAV